MRDVYSLIFEETGKTTAANNATMAQAIINSSRVKPAFTERSTRSTLNELAALGKQE